MAHVVVRPPFDPSRQHRQQWLRAVERLDLALLIHTQDQGLLRQPQIQLDDVADFFNEQRVVREFECLPAARLGGRRYLRIEPTMFQFETEKDQWSQGTKELLDAD